MGFRSDLIASGHSHVASTRFFPICMQESGGKSASLHADAYVELGFARLRSCFAWMPKQKRTRLKQWLVAGISEIRPL